MNFLSSRILLLNDLNSRIPVVVSPNASQSILSGTGSSKPNLEYLPDQFTVQESNFVYTSGKDGVFYDGIPVGEAIFEDDKVKVKLFSDPNQLSFVNVVMDKVLDIRGM